jgi:hypothetical protein
MAIGRMTRSASIYSPSSTSSGAPAPGRRTLTQQIQRKASGDIEMPPQTARVDLGDDYLDRGTVCDADPNRGDCFLTPGQRSRVLSEYQSRVGAAMGFLALAIEGLKTETLLKQSEGGLSIIAILVLEGIEMIVTGGAHRALEFAKQYGEHALEHLAQGRSKAMMEALSRAPVEKLMVATELAIKTGKESVALAAEEPAMGTGEAADKSAVIGLLDGIEAKVPMMEQSLREKVPASLNDPLLLLAWMMWDARNGHSVAAYQHALREKIGRFKMSGLTKMGSIPINGGWDYENTRVFWMDKRHRHLGLYKKTTPHPDGQNRSGQDASWEYEHMIDPEFVEAAVALHQQRWGGPVQDAPTESGNA